MESQEVLKDFAVSDGDAVLSSEDGDGLEQINIKNGFDQASCRNVFSQLGAIELDSHGNEFSNLGGFEAGKGNLAVEFLEDLEEYWEDINDRLMISRMVSDSVIKGMVTAVEQEAAERIANKELQLTNLKKCLQSRDVDSSAFEAIRLPVVQNMYGSRNYGKFSSYNDACLKNDEMREALHGSRNAAKEQFKQVEKDILCVRGSTSIKKIGSGVGLVGLGGILQENECKSSQDLSQILNHLKNSVDTIFLQVDDILQSSNLSLCEWQQEQVLLGKLEDTVIQSAIRSLHEEYKEKLWEQHTQFYGNCVQKWLEKFNEISRIQTQLDAILKSLSVTETGLLSHGSHDLDHLHRKAFSNHVTLPTSLSEGNGLLEAFKTNAHESYDFHQLKHLSKEDMVKHFSGIITRMRRDHESAIQQKTEEYFSLKRDYLNERRSYVTHRKDEEFDVLRKKIPEVITKLGGFFSENNKFPEMIENAETVVKLKGELESLRSENFQLRDTLNDTKKELERLQVQVAEANGKLVKQSLSEVNMLKSSMEELCIEASLTEDIHKCSIKELIGNMRRNSEESIIEFSITREIYNILLIEASRPTDISSRCEIDDFDMEPLILQGLGGMVFKDAMNDAMGKFKDLYQDLLSEKEIRNSLQMKVHQMESEFNLVVEEKDKLKERLLILDKEMENKKISAMDLLDLLSKEREKLELASQETRRLKEHVDQQQTLVNATKRLKVQLMEATEQIELDKVERQNLIQELDQTKEDLTEAIEKRDTALALTQGRHDKLLLREASGTEENKEMEVAIAIANELSTKCDDFECRLLGIIQKNNLRLEEVCSLLKHLTKTANAFRRSGLTDRHRLKRKCADLQMAEAEVDLLGDEVDALLRLLKKIYIALDHYSPVLKHDPRIIETLELVRRELSGESVKLI